MMAEWQLATVISISLTLFYGTCASQLEAVQRTITTASGARWAASGQQTILDQTTRSLELLPRREPAARRQRHVVMGFPPGSSQAVTATSSSGAATPPHMMA